VSRLPRRKVPIAIALKVALRQLGLKKPELDHQPALGLRERTPDGGYIPHEHDPDCLVWRDAEEHAVKTRGNGATTAGSDVHRIAKVRRIIRKREEPAKPKRKIQSRGFEKRPANGWR
jgi:hypothetical protein